MRAQLIEQIENQTLESQRLQAANTELQRQRDALEDEKEDVEKDKERQAKENTRCQKVIEQTDARLSKLREEHVTTKEALSKTILEKEVLDQEKNEIGELMITSEIEISKSRFGEVKDDKKLGDKADLLDKYEAIC